MVVLQYHFTLYVLLLRFTFYAGIRDRTLMKYVKVVYGKARQSNRSKTALSCK